MSADGRKAFAIQAVQNLAYDWMTDLERAEQSPEWGYISDKDMQQMRCYSDAGAKILAVIRDAA